MSLKIKCPVGYEPEIRYIIKTLFTVFSKLNSTYELEFSPNNSPGVIVFTTDNQSLELPLILFSTPDDQWLKTNSFPNLPLKSVDIGSISNKLYKSNLPVLYGNENVEHFSLDGQDKKIGVDILGGLFFMLTSYDEAVIDSFDKHGRVDYKETIAYKGNYLQRPLANEYASLLVELLKQIGVQFGTLNKEYSVVLSHDVDVPLSHNFKASRWLKNSLADVVVRKSVFTPLKKLMAKLAFNEYKKAHLDPYFNLSYIMDVSDRFRLKSQFNFIVINGGGGIDGNYEISSKPFRKILKEINVRGHLIGIHPSYQTYLNPELLKSQVDKLQGILKEEEIVQPFLGGRQHYLRWRNPDTWQAYEDAGVAEDSSIGGSEFFLGYRSGTCYSYPVFNLTTRKELKLKEYPLLIMDVCLFHDLYGFDHEIDEIVEACKFYNGELTLLYHNNYIVTSKQKEYYNRLLNKVVL